MFHSQIAAPSARSSRHHPSLRPPPKHTHARFYVVSSGKAGLSSVAAANSCCCSFYSPRRSNMGKRETKCVSIWLGEEEGEGGKLTQAVKRKYPQRHPRVAQNIAGISARWDEHRAATWALFSCCVVAAQVPGWFAEPSAPSCEHGGIFTALASCKAQSDGNARFYRKSWKPQLCRKERKQHVPSAPHLPIFINDSRKLSCLDKYFHLQSRQ